MYIFSLCHYKAKKWTFYFVCAFLAWTSIRCIPWLLVLNYNRFWWFARKINLFITCQCITCYSFECFFNIDTFLSRCLKIRNTRFVYIEKRKILSIYYTIFFTWTPTLCFTCLNLNVKTKKTQRNVSPTINNVRHDLLSRFYCQ